jgi:hypothetical protein
MRPSARSVPILSASGLCFVLIVPADPHLDQDFDAVPAHPSLIRLRLLERRLRDIEHRRARR